MILNLGNEDLVEQYKILVSLVNSTSKDSNSLTTATFSEVQGALNDFDSLEPAFIPLLIKLLNNISNNVAADKDLL